MIAVLAASPDYRLLCELVATLEGIDLDPSTEVTFETVTSAAASFPTDSVGAQLAEALGLRLLSVKAVIADRILEVGEDADVEALAVRLRTADRTQARAILAAISGLDLGADEVILPLLLECRLDVARGPRSARVAAYLNEVEEVEGETGSHLWDLLGHEGCPILGYHRDELDTLVLCDDGACVVTWNSEARRWEVVPADLEQVEILTRVGARV